MINRRYLALYFPFGAILVATLLLAFPVLAQQQQPSEPQASSSPPPCQTGGPEKDENKSQVEKSGTSKDRLFFALPNFLSVENCGHIPPLTPGQKFKVVTRGAFDYAEYPWYAFIAGIGQAQNSERGFGQGAAGYGKRYGAAFADGTIENFWVGAILPSLFRQDPRFFPMGKGGFWHRAGYAMSRIVVTRSDSGHAEFNFSEILGSAIASGISTYTYHPTTDRNLPNTTNVWGTQIAYDTLTIVVKEFWPDIRRKIKGK